MFENKKVLVAGGTGLIGRQLVRLLIEEGARVRISSLDDASRANPAAEFISSDLRVYENCQKACSGMDFVFNLLGVKGSPAVTGKYPEKFFYNILMLNTQLMEAACRQNVEGFLYTSTNGVYAPAPIMHEDDMWKNPPSPHDKFAGWAKRMGELQAEACQIEYGIKNITVVRPSNVYGPYDNFESINAMVIPSLIKKALESMETGKPMLVWGDGSAQRDFIHAGDVAKGMLLAAKKAPGQVLNVSSGRGTSVKTLVETIVGCLDKRIEVAWDTTKPSGDKERILDNSKLRSLGFVPDVPLDLGIGTTLNWYLDNRKKTQDRYDVFDQK